MACTTAPVAGAVFRCVVRRRVRPRTSKGSRGLAGDSFARYGRNLLRASNTSPIFNYPYHYTREALEQAKLRDEWDACHGLKLKFSNPAAGDFAMPTIGTFIQLLPKGFKTARYRATDATVFAAIEGRGRSRMNGTQLLDWLTKLAKKP
jgi:gentisate 1,2-dioxygenase